MWFFKLIRQFFFAIDSVVYGAISTIYDLMISIARTSVISQADILDMAERIYKLLAIFMIFKVTLSLITYVVNPDDFSDKSKGLSKLSTNIVISLGLLILTPYIFNMAYRLQTIILEDNTLATLIFDTSTSEKEEDAGDFLNSAGDKMAFITLSTFFTPNTSINEFQNCIDFIDTNGKVNPKCSGLKDNYSEDSSAVNTMYNLTEEAGTDNDFRLKDLQNYVAGVNNENKGLMFRSEIATATVDVNDEDTEFVIEYNYILSTTVGVVVLLLLVSFCMDVALRSIKLAFLQLIAPIPILSYVDPKSGKDGMFKKWYQLCFKTFLSLFIRLLALYFAIYIISRLGSMVDIVDGTYQTNAWVKIFVIIGALMFAKDFPKILENLGIKLDGGGKFTLNPLRKMENEMAGGKYLKKPNDALTKFAKGGFGLSTLGKKGIAGAYSAANGRGFRRGWSSVDSPLKKALNKKIDEWAPDFAKDRQESRVARLDAAEAARKEAKVAKYFEKDGGGKDKFLKDLGSIDSKYRDLYDDAENKKVAMYKAQAASNRWMSVINNDRLSNDQRVMLSKHFGAKDGELMTDDDLIRNLQKASGTAEKVYNKAEEAKNNYGKTSVSARRAAELDRSYDAYDKLHVASGEIPKYTEEELDLIESLPTSTNDHEVQPSTTSTDSSDVMDRVEEVTGVSRTSASENGATTSAIVESVMEEIRKEIETAKRTHDTTTDRDEMVRAAERLKELEKELEDIRRRNS